MTAVAGMIQKGYYIGRQNVTNYLDSTKLGLQRIFFSHTRPDMQRKIEWGAQMTPLEVEFGPVQDANYDEFDHIVPLSIAALLAPNLRDLRAPSSSIPLPTPEAVNLCNDKTKLNALLMESGFEGLIPQTTGKLEFPYILKKIVDENSNHCYIIDSPETERKHRNKIDSDEFFCQELVKGNREYASHIIFRKGQIIADLMITYHFKAPYFLKGKDTFISTTLGKTPFVDTFTELLNLIGFEGVCCFNYKIRDGKPLIFEINPRFGASLPRYFPTMIHQVNMANALVPRN